MKTAKLVLMSVLGLSLLLLIAQNTVPVEARFLWFKLDVSAIVLLLLTAVGGFVLGLLVALLARGRSKAKQKAGR